MTAQLLFFIAPVISITFSTESAPLFIALTISSSLKAETEKIRQATSNQYFKFDEEDGVKTFNKREYLLAQSKTRLYAVCKAYNMRKYKHLALYSLVSAILKLPDIEKIIYNLVVTDRHYKIAEEDLDAMQGAAFRNKAKSW